MQPIRLLSLVVLFVSTLGLASAFATERTPGLLTVEGVYEKSDAEAVTIKTESGSMMFVPRKYANLDGLVAGKSQVTVKVPARELLQFNMKRKQSASGK